MSTKQDILRYLDELKNRFTNELPKISKEIKIYEEKLAKGQITKKPKASPQFNG